MKGETAGDPCSAVKWTRKSLRRVSAAMSERGSSISHTSVRRQLKTAGFSLRANRKRLPTRESPHRDEQFKKIEALKRRFLRQGLPVISVDAKKRELMGEFKNAGRTWRREARDVNMYDFPSDAGGVAIPYGVYDVGRDEGFVVVGTSRNTPAFAVSSVRCWWRERGRYVYPEATEILVLADSGGSNGARATEWNPSGEPRHPGLTRAG